MFRPIILISALLVFGLAFPAFAEGEEETIRIQLKPEQEARINSPMTGQVSKVYYRDGEQVKKDAILVSFECSRQKAQLDQVKARLKRQTSLLQSTQELYDLGSASTTELDVLKADMDEAKAALSQAQTEVDHCNIRAPFSGIVSSLSVKDHYSLQEGAPVIELVGMGAMEIEMIVPSKWMQWLKPDHAFYIEIDETGKRYKSKIVRLGGRVDPVTQSIKAYAILDEEAFDLLPGMSGNAIFETPAEVSNAP